MATFTATATGVWPIWYGDATTTATTQTMWPVEASWPVTGTGAWINTTVATWNSNAGNGILRASWVNGTLCMNQPPTLATSISLIPEQIQQIAQSATQLRELDRMLANMNRQIAVRARRKERETLRMARESAMATKRATRLLLRHLDRDQKAMYLAEKRFKVVGSSGTVYEITAKFSHNVFVLDMQGQRVRELCVVMKDRGCPVPDLMLAQLLWIQHMEAEMLSKANVWALEPIRSQFAGLCGAQQTRYRLLHRGSGHQVAA